MPHLKTIDVSPIDVPRWRRVWEAVRSSWSGPLTSSSPEIARYFTDGSPSRAGVAVTGDTALTYPAFWAAVSLIAADIASLPLILYRRLPNGGKERFSEHQLYRILHDEPNPEMTSMVYRETQQAHVLAWGNGYAEIERDRLNRVSALWPLTPNRVTPFRPSTDPYGPLRYRVLNEDNTETVLQAQDVLHIPGLGYDGYLGYSVVAKARESLGLGLAMQQFGASFFGNGSTFGGVITSPRALGDKEKKDFVAELKGFHQGLDRAHRFVLLEGGMDYKRLGVPPDDAQFLESRSFHISEIARWFKVPPHKLGDLSRATFSNIEHQAIDYVTTCLRPWARRWEQEINRKLIAPSERKIQFVEHLFEDLLKGDIQSRYAAYAVGRQWGWLSADDVREKENMNPLPSGSGSMYLVPQNMWPADKVDEMIAAQASKGSPPSVAPADGDTASNLARQLDGMTARAQLAEGSLSEVREKLEGQTVLAAELEKQLGEKDQAVIEAKAARDALSGQVSHLSALSADLNAQRDRLVVDIAEARAATEMAQAERATAQGETLTERTAREAAETARQIAEQDAAHATRQADTAAEEARTAAEAARIAREAEAAAVGAYTIAAQAGHDAEAARAAAETERDAARAEAIEANDRRVAVARDLEAAQQLITESEARLAALTGTESTLRADLERSLGEIRRLETELAAEQAVKDTEIRHARERLDAAAAAVERAEQQATEAREAQHAADAARRDVQSRMKDRQGAEIAARRAGVASAMTRMIAREVERAKSQQQTRAKLEDWIDRFYPGHEKTCAKTLLDAVRHHTVWMDDGEDPQTLALILAREHIEESKRQIMSVLQDDEEEIAGGLYQLFEHWTHERVNVIADALMQKEIDRAADASHS